MHRVILVSGPKLYRDALRARLASEPGLLIVGEAPDASRAGALISLTSAAVVLVDLSQSETSTRSVSVTLEQNAGGDPSTESACVVSTGQGVDDLVAAIHAVGEGRALRPSQRPIGPEQRQAQRRDTPLETLSPREREVFHLVVAGLTNKQMATELRVSIKTVETHRSSINRKLAVHSTPELLRFAWHRGLVQASAPAAE